MNAVSPVDYDNVAGNAYDKYNSANPIARRLMRGFFDSVDGLLAIAGARTAFEVGSGEGHLSTRLLERGIDVRGCDVDETIVAGANASAGGSRFSLRSVYDMRPAEISADLIVCCEVLEHLPDPRRALEIIAGQKAKHWLLSVPREPIWRALNIARGKYLTDLGNTPGHIQHFSSRSFQSLVSEHLRIIDVRKPLPWTMLLCVPR